MGENIPEEEQSNFETFRECLSEPVLRTLAHPIEKSRTKKKKKTHAKKGSKTLVPIPTPDESTDNSKELEGANDAEDLGEFIDV